MNEKGSFFKNDHRGLWSRLQIFRGLITRLVNLVGVTQQDLMEAGVVLHRVRD